MLHGPAELKRIASLGALAARLQAQHGAPIEAAQIRILGLDAARRAAELGWPELRATVKQRVFALLSRHAQDGDVLAPTADGALWIWRDGARGDDLARLRRDMVAALPEVAARHCDVEAFSCLLSEEGARALLAAYEWQGGAAPEIAAAPVRASLGASARLIGPARVLGRWRRFGYDAVFALSGEHGQRDFLELDLRLLDAAALSARAGVCVHASTLQREASRTIYVKRAQEFARTSAAPVFVYVAEVPLGAPLLALADWCAALRPAFERVCLEMHHGDRDFSRVAGAGAWAGAYQLPLAEAAQIGWRANAMIDQARTWASGLHGHGLAAMIGGVHDRALAEGLEEAGADLMYGDAMWRFTVVDVPQVSCALSSV